MMILAAISIVCSSFIFAMIVGSDAVDFARESKRRRERLDQE